MKRKKPNTRVRNLAVTDDGRVIQLLPPAVRAEYSASLPYGLKLYLADAPFGAWAA